MQKLKDKNEILSLLPLIISLFLVPLIVKLKAIKLEGDYYQFWTGQTINYDFFSYYKMIFIIIAAVLAILILVIKLAKKDIVITKNKVLIPIGIYSILIILSTIFSTYKKVALNGFVDRYEGAMVLIAYMALMVFAMIVVKNEKHIKILIGVLLSSAIIIGLIGLTQFFGHDIFQNNTIKSFILGTDYKSQTDNLRIITEGNSIYSTLYHKDYVGSYMAMLFPLTFVLFILVKGRINRVILGSISVLMFINLFGSHSRAGYLGGIVAFITFVIIMYKNIIRNWKQFLIGFIVLIVVIAAFNKITNNSISSRVASLGNDIKTILSSSKSNTKDKGEDSVMLKDIKIIGNNASIITSTETLNIEVQGDNINFKNKDNEYIQAIFAKNTGEIKLVNQAYKDYKVKVLVINGGITLEVNKEFIRLYFAVDQDKLKLVDYKGKEITLEPVKRWGFDGMERIGSSRGYIWSRAIPMLKDTILLGQGPDTFPINFPQYDFKGKMYAYYGDMWQVVDKPHSFYLQTALSTGILSLITLLVFFGLYILSSIKVYMKNSFEDIYSIIGVAIFVAVIGYLISIFFNDSVVSVAPVFWIILGIGISINSKLKSNKGEI